MTKLKPFSEKVRQSVQNYLNQNLVIASFVKNGFEVTISSKTNVLSIWKGHFSVLHKFLSDNIEIIFWKSEAKRSRLFKSNFGHRKPLRKWFCSYFELENECSETFEKAILQFFEKFEWRSWNLFLGKRCNATKTFSIKPTLLGAF